MQETNSYICMYAMLQTNFQCSCIYLTFFVYLCLYWLWNCVTGILSQKSIHIAVILCSVISHCLQETYSSLMYCCFMSLVKVEHFQTLKGARSEQYVKFPYIFAKWHIAGRNKLLHWRDIQMMLHDCYFNNKLGRARPWSYSVMLNMILKTLCPTVTVEQM